MKNFSVFCSGNGSNLQALIDAVASGAIPARIGRVVSDKPECRAIARARAAGIETFAALPRDFPSKADWEKAAGDAVEAAGSSLVVLAGFMRILGLEFVERFAGRLVNIHPSLLPAFPGGHAIRDAFEAGVKETGCTVHFVIPAVDAGPVIAQARVSVESGETLDSLEAKIHRAEHALLTSVVKEFMAGKVEVPLSLRPS